MTGNNHFLEKIAVQIFPDEGDELSIAIADIIAKTIAENNQKGKKTVLGLATGHTPLDVYRELIRRHKEQGLSFVNVITFNLDEYYGLSPEDERSYHRFMQENLFHTLDIKKENIHIPDGMVKESDISDYCLNYEAEIEKTGGIDIQILGIGRDGHIGFNEPGSNLDSKTRLIILDEITRRDALPDFGEIQYVPKKAITMGLATILKAKKIILIARGDHKAKIIKETVEEPVTSKIAASFLQKHPQTIIFTDQAAASELTRFKTPWLLGSPDWSNEKIVNRAVVWLSEKTKKTLANLTADDFNQNQLNDLLTRHPGEKLTKTIREYLQNCLKSGSNLPEGEKIIVFSPHPDDDVISLAGTLKKLLKNNNKICSVYMTPGYNAVFDYAVLKLIRQKRTFNEVFRIDDKAEPIHQKIVDFLQEKNSLPFGSMDIPEVLKVKTIIRMTEAISACDLIGIKNYEFLEMPFYRTGGAKKMPASADDVEIVLKILQKYQPDIIFAANDLNDPNGTHRLCLTAIKNGLEKYGAKPQIWFYRGAWQEFHPLEANVLVPLTPTELYFKRLAIFRHESQKDTPPQPGASDLEFWQRAETKNKATAELLKTYGVGDYYAVETFKITDAI